MLGHLEDLYKLVYQLFLLNHLLKTLDYMDSVLVFSQLYVLIQKKRRKFKVSYRLLSDQCIVIHQSMELKLSLLF
jgi:hypothetical protein